MNKSTQTVRIVAVLAGLSVTLAAAAGEIVVVMAPDAAPLTKNQVSDLYIGRNKDLKPLDLPDNSPEKADFYKKATDRDLAQIKAVWSRIAFTGLGQPPKQMGDDAAVKKAVAADPKAVGYIDKANVDASVKVVLDLH
jgi:ABC-type phosphate transport system substrate-binding protein